MEITVELLNEIEKELLKNGPEALVGVVLGYKTNLLNSRFAIPLSMGMPAPVYMGIGIEIGLAIAARRVEDYLKELDADMEIEGELRKKQDKWENDSTGVNNV